MSLEPKIIVYDSGIGGRAIFEKCSNIFANCGYFSDSFNFPYGTKTFNELKKIFIKNITTLDLNQDDLLVLACNTISCVYDDIKDELALKYEVISALDCLLEQKKSLIIATEFTSNYLSKLGYITQSFSRLAELIEKKNNDEIVLYLKNSPIFSFKVIYGCTHYPIIHDVFNKIYPQIEFINPDYFILNKIKLWIQRCRLRKT